MNVRICEKCQHWREYMGLDDRNRVAMLRIGCMLFSVPESPCVEKKFRKDKYIAIRDCMRGDTDRNGKPPCGCVNGSPLFGEVLKPVMDEYNLLKKKAGEMPVTESCPFLAEQRIEEWNNGKV